MSKEEEIVVETAGAIEPARTEPVGANETSKEKTISQAVINGQTMESWPQDLYIPPDALEVFLEAFQGPLDLLLYLIRKQNIDVLNIPVAEITRQYMEYVELMRRFQLDLAAEYLLMAAMLAEIKSRMLLPRPKEGEGEEEDPRAALIKRLQEYERYRQAARDLDEQPRLERDLYLVAADFEDPAPVAVEARASVNDLVIAFRTVLDRMDHNRRLTIGRDTLSLRERMTLILDRMREKKFLRFVDLFEACEGRMGLVVSFIAILELARDNMLVVVQNEPFAPIHVKAIE